MTLIEQLKHFDPTLRFELKVPGQSRLVKTAQRIEGMVDTLPSAPQQVPQELIDRSLNACKEKQAHTLSNRELRVLCIAGLNSIQNVETPGDAVVALLEEVKQRSRGSLFRALLSGYLQIADLNFGWVRVIRSYLSKHSDSLPRKWITRCREYDLLSKEPCKKLSELFWTGEEFEWHLNQAGITGSLRTTGIGKQFLHTLCEDLGKSDWLLRNDAAELLEKFLSLITKDEELVYTGLTSQLSIVTALLAPCRENLPEGGIQKRIERFLLSAYTDPRVNPGKWVHIPEQLVQIVKRWLTKQAMGLLLEVLNRTADDAHWEARNEFWGYYLDNDLVEEAWVVFGPDAYRHAKDLVVSHPDFNPGTFGTFRRGGGQVMANHSVLLMRIDNVVIAEWTHNGRVRLWEQSTTTRPAFYRQTYFADELRGSGIKYQSSEEHTHDHYGHWKGKVDKFIYDRTGIKHDQVQSRSPRSRPRIRTAPPPLGNISRKISNQSRERFLEKEKSAEQTVANALGLSVGTCKSCGKTKPASEFFMSKKRRGKLTQFCRDCLKKHR